MSLEKEYRFIQRLKELSFVDTIYLYGSRARGDFRPKSDIDLSIACPSAAPEQWQQILDIIDEADTLLPIDAVRWDCLPEGPLKQNIRRHNLLLYRKETTCGNS